MTESNPTSVECPVCGEAFDPTAAGGWCTNSECGEWKYEGEEIPDPDESVAANHEDHVPLDAITGSASRDVPAGDDDTRQNGEDAIDEEDRRVTVDSGPDDERQADRENKSVRGDGDGTGEGGTEREREGESAELETTSAGSGGDEIDDGLDAIDDRLEDVDESSDDDDEDEGETTIDCPDCGETLYEENFFIHDCSADASGESSADATGDSGAESSAKSGAGTSATAETGAATTGKSDTDTSATAETGAGTPAETGAETSAETGAGASGESSSSTACPSCGESVEPGANFCPGCGADLTESDEEATLTECPACGGSVTGNDDFCPNCGEELAALRQEDSGGTSAVAGGEDTTSTGDTDGRHPETLVLRARGREVTVRDGDAVGREFRRILTRTGGDEDDAVRIHRKHVRFVREGGEFDLIDLGENPTEVNGRKLEKGDRRPIGPGDTITLSNILTADVEAP